MSSVIAMAAVTRARVVAPPLPAFFSHLATAQEGPSRPCAHVDVFRGFAFVFVAGFLQVIVKVPTSMSMSIRTSARRGR